MKIAVFFHGLFSHGNPREIRPHAFNIVQHSMEVVQKSGLADMASEIHTCFNGPEEERVYAQMCVPQKATITMHGPDSFAENLTIVKLWEWAKSHPGWVILYFHAKSATHDPTHPYTAFSLTWRNCMITRLVANWHNAIADLNSGAEMVCCHWLENQGSDQSQHIPAGNFLWITSDFVNTLPSMHLRDRIRVSGIAHADSRYEAEVFWGNGPRKPIVRDYHPGAPCSG